MIRVYFLDIMRTLFVYLIVAFISLVPAIGETPVWETDYDKALSRAGSEKKKLLIVFRGPSSNPHCKKVHEEVLDGEEFRTVIGNEFVLMQVLPMEDVERDAEETKTYKEIVRNYHVRTYPLLILADSAGRVYGQTVVYDPEPHAMVGEILKLRPRADLLEAVLESAAAFREDRANAKRLSDALTALGDEFSLTHYSEIVKELTSWASENDKELKAMWERKESNREVAQFNQAYVSIAQRLWQMEVPDDQVALIDATIERYGMKGMARQMMEMRKHRVWSAAGDTQKMLEAARAAIACAPDSPMVELRLKQMVEAAEELLRKEKNESTGKKATADAPTPASEPAGTVEKPAEK